LRSSAGLRHIDIQRSKRSKISAIVVRKLHVRNRDLMRSVASLSFPLLLAQDSAKHFSYLEPYCEGFLKLCARSS
jgi:hypothetical protein